MNPLLSQGLRALIDCGTVMCGNQLHPHLSKCVEYGYATHRERLLRGRWYHIISLKIDRQRAINILNGVEERKAA